MSDGAPGGTGACELCARTTRLTRHHLIPQTRHKNKKNKKTFSREEVKTRIALLCPPCHSNVHATFDEKELEAVYNTVERLAADPRIERFTRWVQKQQPGKRVRVRRSHERRSRGKRRER